MAKEVLKSEVLIMQGSNVVMVTRKVLIVFGLLILINRISFDAGTGISNEFLADNMLLIESVILVAHEINKKFMNRDKARAEMSA